MAVAMNQKSAFAERIARINKGQQFEHGDVVGFRTQKAYDHLYGEKLKKPRRTFGDRLMILVAFLSGGAAVVLGRLAYTMVSKIEGLPDAVYDLQGRGVALAALIVALTFTIIFGLGTRGRMQSLVLGCALVHFGSTALATSASQTWLQSLPAGIAAFAAAPDSARS